MTGQASISGTNYVRTGFTQCWHRRCRLMRRASKSGYQAKVAGTASVEDTMTIVSVFLFIVVAGNTKQMLWPSSYYPRPTLLRARCR